MRFPSPEFDHTHGIDLQEGTRQTAEASNILQRAIWSRGPYLHIEVEGCPNMTQAEKTELLTKISGWVNEAIEILSDKQAQVVTNKVRNQVRS